MGRKVISVSTVENEAIRITFEGDISIEVSLRGQDYVKGEAACHPQFLIAPQQKISKKYLDKEISWCFMCIDET